MQKHHALFALAVLSFASFAAQAEREGGNNVILRVDPNSGEILAVEND